MSHREARDFLRQATRIAPDPDHRRKLAKAIANYNLAVDGMKRSQFHDWQDGRQRAAAVKEHVLANLPALLETFESRIAARGAKVLWAEDAAEARAHVSAIVAEHQVRRVVKSKSMVSEEIDLNEHLEASGVEVVESDLGELIVQLNGEKPYHIVTPAMHRSREEIAELFTRKLGIPHTDDAKVLTMAARDHLRQIYTTADLGMTGANFILAEEGAIALTENEGNARLTLGCPPVHLVVVGLEKVLPRLADLALFWPLLATSGTGQQISGYNTVIRGPRQSGETDGPDHLYVILLDNGRSRLYADDRFREALRCIRCGACLNACPVFKTVGGHTYHTTYQGPIGSVITPHLKGHADWHHLSQASSLCGACTASCPVGIDLHGLLLDNRQRATEAGAADRTWALAMKGWAIAMGGRRRMELAGRLARFAQRWLPLPRRLRQTLPTPAPKSFAQLWRETEEKRR